MALLLPLLSWAGAPAASSMNAWRSRVVTDPRGFIAYARAELDHAGRPLAPARERALLWAMGTAAINDNDDAALVEATLRLDSLGRVGKDSEALAAADYLRARHDIANGIGAGLSLALQAAVRMQATTDPQIVAWSRFQLCDAYALDERAKKALPLCRQSLASYVATDDRWGIADAENDLGIVLATLNRVAAAAGMYEHSRRDFAAVGADEMVVMVGDNLSQMYLKMGRVREALALSKASLAQELADGRISDSLGSSTDIARAEAALGQHHRAYATIRQAVARARGAGMDGELADVLEVESEMAEKIGLLKVALVDVREALKLNEKSSTPAVRAIEAELELRYATREKVLRIHDLERENRINSLALKAVHAEAAQRVAEQRRTAVLGRVSVMAAVGLLLLATLLLLLLRNQRRYAAELQLQALRDPLTGIENRRAFMQRANRLLQEPWDPQRLPHVLMLIDFDHFKRINDSAGHQAGDHVLGLVADFIQTCLDPQQGHVARIGGEEFAVLCPFGGAEVGMRLAETLRAGIADLPLPAGLPQRRITVSIGVAVFDGHQRYDLSSWMRAADNALYSAKAHGRDRVVASVLMM